MCARQFLIAVFILTLLVVAAGFAVYQWGGNILLKQATPKGHFQAAAAGGAPDYSQPSSWLSRPGMTNDPSRWTPEGAGEFDAAIAQTATFYIHPTTYLRTDRWNAPLDPDAETAARTRLFVQSQASAFNFSSEIWAPKYRQAAYGSFLLKDEDARKALDLAYSDVRAAFDAFLAAQPKDRPIILAGHSQGALHLLRLLQDRHEELKGRLVAAYVIGWPISTTADLPALGLPGVPHRRAGGLHPIVDELWRTANPNLILDEWSKTSGPTGGERAARRTCFA